MIGFDDMMAGGAAGVGTDGVTLLDIPQVVAGATYVSGNSADQITGQGFIAGPIYITDATLNGNAVKALRCEVKDASASGYAKRAEYVIGTGNFTIEVWFRLRGIPPASAGGYSHNLINRVDPYSPNRGFALGYDGANGPTMSLSFSWSTEGGYQTSQGVGGSTNVRPHTDFTTLRHACATLDANTVRVFENGQMVASGQRSNIWDGDRDLQIGGNTYGGNADWISGANMDVFAWRLTRACRWTEPFDPPPVPLTK